MSMLLRAAAIGLALSSGGLAPASAQQAPAGIQAADAAADPVLAIVDGTAIRRSDLQGVQRALPAQFQQMPLEMLFPLLIDRMIDAKLLAIAGRKDNIHAEPELRARVESFEERLIQEAYLTRRITAAATEDAIQARYRKFVAENPAETEVSARHILSPRSRRRGRSWRRSPGAGISPGLRPRTPWIRRARTTAAIWGSSRRATWCRSSPRSPSR